MHSWSTESSQWRSAS